MLALWLPRCVLLFGRLPLRGISWVWLAGFGPLVGDFFGFCGLALWVFRCVPVILWEFPFSVVGVL